MARRVHFISGLPRSGSTLLATLLNQNPAFRAGVQSPLCDIIRSTLQMMSSAESAVFIDDGQRQAVLRSIVESFYGGVGGVAYDTNRNWCSLVGLIATLWPESYLICCVRNPAWIVDSLERLVQANPLRASRMFGFQTGTVFSRVEEVCNKQLVLPSLQAFRHAWYSPYASRLIVVTYGSLVASPRLVLERIYDLLGEAPFEHDFIEFEHDEPYFDTFLNMPGMHRVRGPVAERPRETILPPELFAKYDNEFWLKSNPGNVKVL